MKTLAELTSTDDPALPLIQSWIASAAVDCEILPPSKSRGEALLSLQVSTRSPMGAIVFETGGLLLDRRWLRILGSGHAKLTRSLPGWNEGRSGRFLLVADDAIGGFFAINGGGLGEDLKSIYYFAPDSLNWEPLKMGYSDFVIWALSGRLAKFYESSRWPTWREDTTNLHGDQCFSFYPPLFTSEGSVQSSQRKLVPVAESWGAQMDFKRQLDGN